MKRQGNLREVALPKKKCVKEYSWKQEKAAMSQKFCPFFETPRQMDESVAAVE
jgi:hypothetical protein